MERKKRRTEKESNFYKTAPEPPKKIIAENETEETKMSKTASDLSQKSASRSGTKMSVTFRVDKGVVEHNNREFVAKNVVRERISQNIIYKREDIREKYHELFDNALEEYNSRQKRADRKINDYYAHLKKSQNQRFST